MNPEFSGKSDEYDHISGSNVRPGEGKNHLGMILAKLLMFTQDPVICGKSLTKSRKP